MKIRFFIGIFFALILITNTINVSSLALRKEQTNVEDETLDITGNITATGNVGIGVAIPLIDLAVGDDDTGLVQLGDGNISIYSNGISRLFINSDGNVGIGLTNPVRKLEVDGEGYFNASSTTEGGQITLQDGTAQTIGEFIIDSFEAGLRIFNNTSATSEFTVFNAAGDMNTKFPDSYNQNVGGTNHALYIDNGGLIGKDPSSLRYKENIFDIGEDSEYIYALRPVKFNYKSETMARINHGLIAEEVDLVNEHLVAYDDEEAPNSVYYERLVPDLLNELIKQKAIIDLLIIRIDALESA